MRFQMQHQSRPSSVEPDDFHTLARAKTKHGSHIFHQNHQRAVVWRWKCSYEMLIEVNSTTIAQPAMAMETLIAL